jgi:hypothetical protein
MFVCHFTWSGHFNMPGLSIYVKIYGTYGDRGVIMVKALHYKPADRGFDSRWCHWNFSVTKFFRSHYGLGVDSVSNRNEY